MAGMLPEAAHLWLPALDPGLWSSRLPSSVHVPGKPSPPRDGHDDLEEESETPTDGTGTQTAPVAVQASLPGSGDPGPGSRPPPPPTSTCIGPGTEQNRDAVNTHLYGSGGSPAPAKEVRTGRESWPTWASQGLQPRKPTLQTPPPPRPAERLAQIKGHVSPPGVVSPAPLLSCCLPGHLFPALIPQHRALGPSQAPGDREAIPSALLGLPGRSTPGAGAFFPAQKSASRLPASWGAGAWKGPAPHQAVFVFSPLHLCTHSYSCTHAQSCTHTTMCAHLCTCTHTHNRAHTDVETHSHELMLVKHVHTRAHITPTCVHSCAHTCAHALRGPRLRGTWTPFGAV